jgi:hypothetical protein
MLKMLVCAALATIPALGIAQSVVCGGKIINEGVSQVEVSAKCGTPAQVDHHTRNLVAAVGAVSQPSYVVGTSDDVDVDVWTYNFGPNKLMQRIWFEGGLVKRVESLGYGF